MSKESSERKLYRKSPGRQYGYDYDPLRNRNGEQAPQEEQPRRVSTQLVQRPDLRRTRELTRKNILASRRAANEPIEGEYDEEVYESPTRRPAIEELEDPTFYSSRRQARSIAAPNLPSTRELIEADEDDDYSEYAEDEVYPEYAYQDVDPDQGYDEEELEPLRYASVPAPRAVQPAPRTGQLE